MDYLDEDTIYKKIQHEVKRFLTEFPKTKLELAKYVQDLYCMADRIDKIHKNCTIANVAASSTSAVSGILTVLGFVLSPVTAGGSLALSITGMGLGAAATITGASANIIDNVSDIQGRVRLDKSKVTIDGIEKVLHKDIQRIIRTLKNLKKISQHYHAFSLVKANPGLISATQGLTKAGRLSTQSSQQIDKAFQGTALAMTKKARIIGASLAGLFVLVDVATIVQDSKHLSKGAKTTTAAKLRERAQILEKNLQELSRVYEILLKMEI
ncbi:apolipoprotein L6-like [Dromiciops gliroides]|uniref:apolipoprotein L6-like n=1 Tax=Dromiciops gliroides TaxID=33562 RepID=UPI001CC59568|nr:apolipoprotein L6-like [Dromiciops gliroides]